MKIIELILDEAQDIMGIDAISIVENPAIEENFLALKNEEIKLAEIDKEKKILMGALLIPNKPIYRTNAEGEYYIYFSRETVEKASQLYLKNGHQNNSTLEHQHELNGLTLVESWIVEDTKFDKSRKYGLNVPVGTWMGSIKVNNEDVWNEYVKTGKVKGFSIEGYFVDKMQTKTKEENALSLLSEIKNIILEESVMVVNEDYAIIDDRLAYSSQEKAEKVSEDIGCGGSHIHEFEGQKWYMPCEEHSVKAGKNTKSPCWDGYEQKGWKTGSTGKRVPNCEKKK